MSDFIPQKVRHCNIINKSRKLRLRSNGERIVDAAFMTGKEAVARINCGKVATYGDSGAGR